MTNTGNVPVDGVTIEDPMLTSRKVEVKLDKTTLAVGEKATATALTALTQTDLDAGEATNTAKAKGTAMGNASVESAEATAKVTIARKASLSVEKTADVQEAKVGDTITYTIKVTNTGNVTLAPVTITDAESGDDIIRTRVISSPNERRNRQICAIVGWVCLALSIIVGIVGIRVPDANGPLAFVLAALPWLLAGIGVACVMVNG